MGKPKKFKLELDDGNPLSLIGILTDETDLKLSWLINKELSLKLSRDEDLNWLSKEVPNPLAFPVYSDQKSRLGPIRLLKNRSIEGLMIKEYKQVDYLFIMLKTADQSEYGNLISQLQQLDVIRGVYVLDPAALKPWIE